MFRPKFQRHPAQLGDHGYDLFVRLLDISDILKQFAGDGHFAAMYFELRLAHNFVEVCKAGIGHIAFGGQDTFLKRDR